MSDFTDMIGDGLDAMGEEAGESVIIRGVTYSTATVSDLTITEESEDTGGLEPGYFLTIVLKLSSEPAIPFKVGDAVTARGKAVRALRVERDEASVTLICDNPQGKSR